MEAIDSDIGPASCQGGAIAGGRIEVKLGSLDLPMDMIIKLPVQSLRGCEISAGCDCGGSRRDRSTREDELGRDGIVIRCRIF